MDAEEWAGWMAIAAFALFVIVVFLLGMLAGRLLS